MRFIGEYNKHSRMIFQAHHELVSLFFLLDTKYESSKLASAGGEFRSGHFESIDDLIVLVLKKLWLIPRGYYQRLLMLYLISSVIDTFGSNYTYSLRRFWASEG